MSMDVSFRTCRVSIKGAGFEIHCVARAMCHSFRESEYLPITRAHTHTHSLFDIRTIIIMNTPQSDAWSNKIFLKTRSTCARAGPN